ncbi:MAG: tRNA (adenosine(37)-N6)-threonylcarbamoyltransferase complex dimerization subunit type 1 TsaB [Bacilli bacterium]
MKSLWIDTSSYYLYVGIMDQTMLFSKQIRGKNNHSEHLLDTIKEGLASLGWHPSDLERIIVGIGPGSYTGLRVSLTVAKTLAWTLKLPLYTISSLDFALSGYLNDPGCYMVLMHAKKDYHFVKVVQITSSIEVLHEEAYLEDQAIELIQKSCSPSLIISEEGYRYQPEQVPNDFLNRVEDIYLLEPQYLRGEM